MLIALCATAIVVVALLWEISLPYLDRRLDARRARRLARERGVVAAYDPRTGAPYAYLIYPHKPIVAYVPKTGRLLSEYCVEFPDLTGAISHSRLPDSDDVLAKWMALTGDEERLVEEFRRQLDEGMWAAVPVTEPAHGRRQARMVRSYADVPAEAERVIFFPRAAGG